MESGRIKADAGSDRSIRNICRIYSLFQVSVRKKDVTVQRQADTGDGVKMYVWCAEKLSCG